MIDYCIHMIKRVARWAASDRGDVIQLETIDENQKPVILRMEFQDVSRFAQAVVSAAMIAEQRQRTIPNQDLKVVSPWMAVEIQSGTSGDGKIVALIFQTTEGVPIEVAMSPEIARETIGLLSTELLRIETGQHTKLS
jgi:hypothetical protein